MTAMNSDRRTGRRYGREFKNNAVALVQSGRTITEVARDLGVSKWSLGHWARAARNGQPLREPGTLGAESAAQRELRRLRQEVEHVGRQRDGLKKSLGHLASGGAAARFTLMEKLRDQYPAAALTEALEVSPSGFAAHRAKLRAEPADLWLSARAA